MSVFDLDTLQTFVDRGEAAQTEIDALLYGICRVCGCTDENCQKCVAKTGEPCHWVDKKHTLCSACVKPS